jgi:hypothetical protein
VLPAISACILFVIVFLLILCGRILWTPLFVSLYHTDPIADTFFGSFQTYLSLILICLGPAHIVLLLYEFLCTTLDLMCDGCVLNT